MRGEVVVMNHVELNPDDACMIKLTSGHAVDARYIECLIQDVIPAVEHAVVFGHNSPFFVVVFTLKLDPELGGRLLGEDAMHMSEQFGSKANTVFTARNCPQFCTGMRDVFRMINVALKQHCEDESFKIRRACLLLSKLNQEDGMITSDGSYNRQQILRKHHHVINSMLDVQAARNVIDVTPCDDDETCDHGLKLRSYEDWLKFEQAGVRESVSALRVNLFSCPMCMFRFSLGGFKFCARFLSSRPYSRESHPAFDFSFIPPFVSLSQTLRCLVSFPSSSCSSPDLLACSLTLELSERKDWSVKKRGRHLDHET